MMQFRNSQQAQQANALQMQYAAEDRARAEQGRRAAAGNALAERAALSKALENSVVGVAGPEQPNLGNAQKDLAMQGRFGAASTISTLQEQFAKQKEQEAKAAGQSLTNTGLDLKNADTRLTQLQRFAPAVADAQSAANYGRMVAEQFPELANLFGSPEDAAKRSAELFAKDPAGWLRHSLNLTGEQLVQANAADVKAKSEAGASKAGVFGDTNEGRQLQIVNEVLKGTRLPSDPEYALAYDALYAGKSIPAYNPETKQMELVKAPATAPANLPPPTLGKASAATPPLTMASVASNLRPPANNALSTMNGALRPPVQANALAAPPDAPIITSAPSAPSAASEAFNIKQKETELGRPKVTVTVQKMMDSFNELDRLGVIVNDEKPISENFMAMLSGGVFADALPLINPKAATRRGVLKTLTETAISQIAASAGLTAKQMDSNADVKRIRVMVSGPEEGFTIQAVRESLTNLDAAYGTGTAKSAAPATATSDKIARSADIEHTAKQNNMSLEDTKKRLRSMGYKIEGE
jgi:hypothetical protein